MTFANCAINHGGNTKVMDLIKDRGFNFQSYEKLCNRLAANDAGLMIGGVSQISPYQTTVAITITMYPKGDKYEGTTIESVNWIRYSEQRTSQTEKEELYDLAMYALDQLTTPSNEEKLKKMLIEVSDMRKATK